VTTVINKVQAYEQSPPPGSWMRRAILVADDGNSAFPADMETVAGFLPPSITPTKMYSYNPGTSVESEVGPGALLLAYSGHGNSTSWGWWSGGGNIYNKSKISNMWNGNKLPFMAVANCSNGYFVKSDTARVLAEEFLLIQNKGGLASWAPASYAYPSVNTPVSEALHREIFVNNNRVLGSAATTARLEAYLANQHLPLSLFETFTFFGDPATRLNMPAILELSGQVAPNPVVMGNEVTYTLTYAVSGLDEAPGLTLANTLPPHTTYQSASLPPSSINGQTLTWNLGDTQPGSSDTITVVAQVNTSGLAHGQSISDQARLYDATGGDQIIQLETTVEDSPIAGLLAGNDSPTQLGSNTTLFASTTAGSNVVYTWDFGDGSPPESGQPIQHIYPAIDTYTARVTAANGVSSQSRTTTVTITDVPPSASFVSSTPDRVGQITTFQSTSTGTNLSYEWDFGDGTPPAGSQTGVTTHAYTAIGTYTAVLTVTNSLGSSSTANPVEILEAVVPPVVGFASSTPDELGQTTVFTNTSQDGGEDEENITYAWNFGDGTSSVDRHPTHIYQASGSYTVWLTITNSVAGDTVSDTVVVEPSSSANNSPIFLPLIIKNQ
jgi:uncharacterized repeat protein (TIGR01451 family)